MLRMALHWQILITMLLGATIGVVLNATAGRSPAGKTVEHPAGSIQLLGMSEAVHVDQGTIWSFDTPERILIQLTNQASAQTRRIVVGEPLRV